MGFTDRLRHAWNAFTNNRDPTYAYRDVGPGYSHRPDRPRLSRGKERSIVTSVFNRIALDAAAIAITHCETDKDGRYVADVNSGLNKCLTLEANVDQTGRTFKHDMYLSTLDEGVIAVVPTDTDLDPTITGGYDIESIRVGRIIEWFPEHVRVELYNERTGRKEKIVVPKKTTAIIENPLYAVVNEPNSTLQRLIRKLNLLDAIDEQSGSGKLDLIIQLPYVVKTDVRRQQSAERIKAIEDQLRDSPFGIAYIDGTEKVTQLNRPVENNLMKQIEYLTSMLYSQLGITQTILDGTADEKTMLNYYNRAINPLVAVAVDEMKRKFLTKTARTKGYTIKYFRDPFVLVPVNELAEAADKFTRNEIMTSNEIRQIMGMKPSKDPSADELRNKNLNKTEASTPQPVAKPIEESKEGGTNQNGEL